MPARPCSATAKAGHPCRAPAIGDLDTCLVHASEEERRRRNFQQGQSPGRPRLPRPSEVARRLIESNELALQRPYWRALGFDVRIGDDGPELVELEGGGAKLYGTSGKDGTVAVSDHDDLEAMQRAAERLQDRVYGKPKQTTELTGADGDAIRLEAPVDALERSRRAAQLLGETALKPAEPHPATNGSNGNGNGNGAGGH